MCVHLMCVHVMCDHLMCVHMMCVHVMCVHMMCVHMIKCEICENWFSISCTCLRVYLKFFFCVFYIFHHTWVNFGKLYKISTKNYWVIASFVKNSKRKAVFMKGHKINFCPYFLHLSSSWGEILVWEISLMLYSMWECGENQHSKDCFLYGHKWSYVYICTIKFMRFEMKEYAVRHAVHHLRC